MALERAEAPRVLHGVVRSTAAEALAEVSALVRARLPGAVCSAGHGEAGQGERGEFRDERGAQRRGEEDTAVTLPVPSNVATAVSVRHSAGSAASRRPSEARNERSEWRREGYPPEGTRPRSGLGRVARSRSDAPSLVVWTPEPVSIFCTIVTVIANNIVTIADCTIAVLLTVTNIGSVSNIVGVDDSSGERSLSLSVATS